MQRLYERTIRTLRTGRLIEGGRLIQGRYIQVRLYFVLDVVFFCKALDDLVYTDYDSLPESGMVS